MAGDVTRTSWVEAFRLRFSGIVWFVIGLGFLLALPVMLDVSVWAVVAVAAVALVLALPVALIARWLSKRQRATRPLTSYLKAALALLFSLSMIVAAPLYAAAFFTEFRPSTVPQAVLSNGKQTLVFQGMSHIGSEPFYKGVVYDLENALSQGYIIYYEGVQPSPDGDAWFSETLAGGGDLSENYKTMGGVCGLQFQQDYFGLLVEDMRTRPERHVMADVSTADMMHEYQRLMADDPDFASAIKAKTAAGAGDKTEDAASDPTLAALKWLQGGPEGLRRLAGVACRGFMTWALSREGDPDPMDKVILEYRNRALADRIVADTHTKIFMTYGAGHLPGLLALLQSKDPAWEIKSVKWLRTIETPEEYTGKI